MKVLLVNAPYIKYNGKISDLHWVKNFAEKVKKPLGKGFNKFLTKVFNLDKFEYGIRAGSRWPATLPFECNSWAFPFIMALTTSYLRKNGIQADMIDCIAEHYFSYDGFFKRVKKYSPDIVIIETSTPTIDIDLYCAKQISKFADVALAGPHITDDTIDELTQNYPFVSYWLKGEYIKSALNMTQTQKKGVYEIELVENLDELPFAARDFKGFSYYFDGHMPSPVPQLFMSGSKGCPFSCVYCLWPSVMFKNHCNLRSPENIIAEIKENLAKYPYKSIYFDDDTWNVGTERISKLCDSLKEIGLPWSMMGRLDCSPDWLFDKMVDSGCIGMRFGVETFNVDVLKRINKKLERIDIKNTLEHLTTKYPDLYLHVCMMKNLPGQTEEIHKEDMKIIEELGFLSENQYRSYQLASCAPFPGTKLYKDLVAIHGEEKMKKWELYDGSYDTIMTQLES